MLPFKTYDRCTCSSWYDPGPCGARRVNAEDNRAGQVVPVVDPELFGPLPLIANQGMGPRDSNN